MAKKHGRVHDQNDAWPCNRTIPFLSITRSISRINKFKDEFNNECSVCELGNSSSQIGCLYNEGFHSRTSELDAMDTSCVNDIRYVDTNCCTSNFGNAVRSSNQLRNCNNRPNTRSSTSIARWLVKPSTQSRTGPQLHMLYCATIETKGI